MKIFFLITALVVGISGVVWYVGKSPVDSLTEISLQSLQRYTVRETDPFKGPRDAPVTIVMAASFTCPACKSGAVIMDQLLALYPGTLKIVWKDFPEGSGEGFRASVAARCAQEQGKFWQYHDLLFARQGELANAVAGEIRYDAWAETLQLNVANFRQCLYDAYPEQLVRAGVLEGTGVQFTTVPYFEINGDPFDGTVSLGVFRNRIDAVKP